MADVEDYIQKAAEAEKFFESVTGTEVPKTFKEASEIKWELALKVAGLEYILRYPAAQRSTDATRVISMREFQRTLREWEEAMVDYNVTRALSTPWKLPLQILDALAGLEKDLEAWGPNVFQALKFALLHLDDPEARAAVGVAIRSISKVWGGVWLAILAAFSAEGFTTLAHKVLAQSESSESKLRSRAFPQSQGKRYRRRKRTRT